MNGNLLGLELFFITEMCNTRDLSETLIFSGISPQSPYVNNDAVWNNIGIWAYVTLAQNYFKMFCYTNVSGTHKETMEECQQMLVLNFWSRPLLMLFSGAEHGHRGLHTFHT